MFEETIQELYQWLCDNTKFKPLENTFDDRYAVEGFLIDSTHLTNFYLVEGQQSVKAIKDINLWIQYKDADLQTFIEGILYHFKTTSHELVSLNTDSKQVFELMTNGDKKYSNRDINFALIRINLIDFLIPKYCERC